MLSHTFSVGINEKLIPVVQSGSTTVCIDIEALGATMTLSDTMTTTFVNKLPSGGYAFDVKFSQKQTGLLPNAEDIGEILGKG